MESFGKRFKKERENRGLSLKEVSRVTRIRIYFLRAIEEDQYESLPPWAYLKGFLAGYAKLLGFDPVEVLARYQENFRPLEVPKYEPLKPQGKILSPGKRVGSFSILAIVMGLVLFVFISFYQDSYEPSAGPSISILPLQKSMTKRTGSLKIPTQAAAISVANASSVKTETDDFIATTPAREVPSFEVIRASLGTRIGEEEESLLSGGEKPVFPCDGRKVYFFNKIRARKDGRILHVWTLENREFNRVEMEIRQPAWSVYSYLTLRPLLAGSWKVEARDGDEILSSLTFKAIQPSPAKP